METLLNYCSDDDRLDFLPSEFGVDGLRVEQLIFNIMSRLVKEYNGGYWEFANTIKGDIPVIVWSTDEEVTARNDGLQENIAMSGRVASVAVNIMAYNKLCWHFYDNNNERKASRYCKLYSDLKDWAYNNLEDEEVAAIYRFLD
jgi:hypothetical protein